MNTRLSMFVAGIALISTACKGGGGVQYLLTLVNLHPDEKQGKILSCQVYEGMSRRAVLYAIGYPPAHENPKLDSDQWKYWLNRFNTIIVHFDGDKVASIQN